jgi:alpha-beta hydrolase superfamily lysophospholipase
VRPEVIIGAALAFACAGLVLDQITNRFFSKLRPLLLTMPAVLLVLLGVQVRQPGNFGSRLLAEEPLFPLRLVLAIPSPGIRLPLEHGTAAWLRETPSDEPQGKAIVLHGNNRRGSKQPSAMVLQGALLRAGYDVVSVDHPGFGASALPAIDDWPAWDPALGPAQALRYLQLNGQARPSQTIVVGHSMGVDVALKFLADGAPVQAVWLWGGSLDRPYGPNWLGGFHSVRNIPCCVPDETMSQIRAEFYGGGDRFAAALSRDHVPLHYVRFGLEHADVTRDREPLYAAIPEPKQACDFANVSHYFNTLAVRGFSLLDTRTIQLTAAIFEGGEKADEICGR